MRSTRTLGAVALVGVSLAFGACGSSDDAGGDALKRSDVVSKANSICTTAKDAASKITPPTDFSDANAAAAYFDKVVPITQKETDDLDALKAGDDAKADLDALVDAQNGANKLLHTIQKKADDKDASGQADLQKVAPAGEKVAAAAKKLGATSCG